MLKKTISLLTLILIIISLTGCTPNIKGKYIQYQNYDRTPSITITDNKIISNYPNDEDGNYKCPYKFEDNKIILDGSNIDNDSTKDFYMKNFIYCDDEDFDFIYGDECVSDGIVPDKDYFDVTLTDVSSNSKWEYVFTESGVYKLYSVIGNHRSLFSQGTYKRDGNFLFIKSENYMVDSPIQIEKYYYIKDGKLYTDVYVRED